MIIYHFDRVFKARGIVKPFAFLKKSGFSDSLASKIKNNKVARLNLPTIEHLCIMLRCTPNDLMEWRPDSNHTIDTEHPIHKLKRSDKIVDITRTLNTVPLDKLDRIEELIRTEINKA